ncbi:hypothetical protein BgiBS90_018473, partial [Biomphalaria glabrata]
FTEGLSRRENHNNTKKHPSTKGSGYSSSSSSSARVLELPNPVSPNPVSPNPCLFNIPTDYA